MSTAAVVLCAHCGKPIGPFQTWLGGRAYHYECTVSPYAQQNFQALPMTETEIRRIVREEIARATKEQQP